MSIDMHVCTQAEEAQKRMEVMYNIYTWSTQLSSRLAAGALLVVAEAAEGHKRTNPDDLVSRAVKQLNADCRYHGARLSPRPSRTPSRSRVYAGCNRACTQPATLCISLCISQASSSTSRAQPWCSGASRP